MLKITAAQYKAQTAFYRLWYARKGEYLIWNLSPLFKCNDLQTLVLFKCLQIQNQVQTESHTQSVLSCRHVSLFNYLVLLQCPYMAYG